MTDDVCVITVEDLIRVCYAWPHNGIKDGDLHTWLSMSSDHFYIKYKFTSFEPKSWSERQPLGPLKLCEMCTTAKVESRTLMSEFLASKEARPLRTLDLFAGSGAFGFA